MPHWRRTGGGGGLSDHHHWCTGTRAHIKVRNILIQSHEMETWHTRIWPYLVTDNWCRVGVVVCRGCGVSGLWCGGLVLMPTPPPLGGRVDGVHTGRTGNTLPTTRPMRTSAIMRIVAHNSSAAQEGKQTRNGTIPQAPCPPPPPADGVHLSTGRPPTRSVPSTSNKETK